MRYNDTESLIYSGAGVYQEAFYDYGTPRSGDNARIKAVSRGSSTNYASIKYAPYGSNSFTNTRQTTYGDEQAIADKTYWGVDYYQPGSYAYSTGTTTLDLNVID